MLPPSAMSPKRKIPTSFWSKDILEPIEDTKELEKIFEIFKTRMDEEFEFEDEE